jgi:hypothetical protein
MAGTMPHAVFVETDVDDSGSVAAYAAELPGCAVFAASDTEAVGAIPRRVARFTAWLRERGETPPRVIGDNWYEVERASARTGDGGRRRAAFSLDELPPSDEELAQYLRWLELAREELAEALDRTDASASEAAAQLDAIATQDAVFVRELEGPAPDRDGDAIDRLYAARDALTDALTAAGPTADGVRRIVRIAIADDVRLAAALAGEEA